MLLVPVVVSLLCIAVMRTRATGREAPLLPATRVGAVALASLALFGVVVLTGPSLSATLPVGAAMLGLGSFARWRQRDPGLLLVVPIVFGLSTLILPLVFE